MTTYATDIIRVYFKLIGTQTFTCRAVGLEWPPPERLYLTPGPALREARDGDEERYILVRATCSQLDDETAAHPHIARGAEYHYAQSAEGGAS